MIHKSKQDREEYMDPELSYMRRYIKAQEKWYKERKKMIIVDWRLFIGVVLISIISIFSGIFIKNNLLNKDLGTIFHLGIPILGGSLAGRILMETFSIGWALKDRKKRLKERRKYK